MVSSRGSSHSRSPSRKRHKKHRHRKRSRSRSRSRTPRIHVNPLFGYSQPSTSAVPQQHGYPNMGYSATQLMQTTSYLEGEMNRMKQQMMSDQHNLQMSMDRISSLSQQLQVANDLKSTSERKCFELTNERRHHIQLNTDLKNKLKNAEYTIQKMELDFKTTTDLITGKDEEITNLKYQNEVVRHQINGLNERNAGLKAKCEEVVIKNRNQQTEIESKKQFVEQARINVQKMEAEVECVKLETKRLAKELEANSEKEEMWKKQVSSLEEDLAKKEEEIRLNKFGKSKALVDAHERIKQLEGRLRNEKPIYQAELVTEAIYGALESVKNTFESQMSRLEEEVEMLRNEKAQREKSEQLPDYLKTPKRQNQQSIEHQTCFPSTSVARPMRPVSGPPMESPIEWTRLKDIMRNGKDPKDINQKEEKEEEDDEVVVIEEIKKDETVVKKIDFNFREIKVEDDSYDDDLLDLSDDNDDNEQMDNFELIEQQLLDSD